MINPQLENYIKERIFPQYSNFDPAHQIDHVQQVIKNSMKLAQSLDVNLEMVYTVAAYHDIGLKFGRLGHESASKQVLLKDMQLRQFFTEEQILIMGDAVEDHRASIEYEPRSVYGKIVSEADRDINLERIIDRTIQFIQTYYPNATYDYLLNDTFQYIVDKYGPDSGIKLWLNNSVTATHLSELQEKIQDFDQFQQYFDQVYSKDTL